MPPEHQPGPPQPRSRITRAFLWIASAALVIMMLVVVGDVVLRAVFNTPLQGAYDIVSIMLLVMVAFGIGPVIVKRAEILIDLIDGLLGPAGVRLLGAVASVLSFAVIVFIGWSMIGPAKDAWRWGGYSLELGVPNWALWVLAFVGLVGLDLVGRPVGYARGQDGQR
ncbi:MAG: TRAP transporter small permease [Pararhodobacter sp.]|nr:TRAP transporter small permease [Pararhodobacter sp.]